MALSFSRPDPSSPSEVSTASFTVARRGYDQAEVRDLLRMVAAEMARLQEREKFLERELRNAQRVLPNAAVALDDEVVTRMLGEEAARILQTAREAASQIKIRAEESSARMLREATDEAQRMREEASVEASRRRQDAASDAESELQMAKQQGREMVNEARAYRERVLSELARRRELARQQIEQLIHGRDRLLQAFERARLAAVDVMAEMTPLGEPTEYVNLAPTTGPVPVMVPADALSRRPEPAAGELVPADGQRMESDVDIADRVDEGRADDDADLAGPSDADLQAIEEAAGVDDRTDAEVVPLFKSAAPTVYEQDDEADDSEADHGDDDEIVSDTQADPAESSTDDDDENRHDDAAADASRGAEADVPEVEDLFARLRAARAQSVAERANLAAAEAHPSASTDDVGEAMVEPPVRRDLRVIGDDPAVFQRTSEAPVVAATFDDESPFGRRDAALTPLFVATARKLKRVLADEQNDVLASLRRKDPVRAIDTLLPWATEQTTRYADAVADELWQAARHGADSVAAGGANLTSARASILEPAVELLTSAVLDPLRDRIARAIDQAGGDNTELASSVRAIYREWKVQRIDEQVEHMVHLAFGRGAYAALTAGTSVCWMVDPDGPACADAEDNALAGAVALGDAFPTGNVCTPAHAGCRCMLQPAP